LRRRALRPELSWVELCRYKRAFKHLWKNAGTLRCSDVQTQIAIWFMSRSNHYGDLTWVVKE